MFVAALSGRPGAVFPRTNRRHRSGQGGSSEGSPPGELPGFFVKELPRFFGRERCVSRVRVVRSVVLRVRAFRTERICWSSAASARRLLMPARETEAIILKTFPLGEADRVVSFLGRSSGRLRGVAAGARRLKNRFGSTLETLSHVQ